MRIKGYILYKHNISTIQDYENLNVCVNTLYTCNIYTIPHYEHYSYQLMCYHYSYPLLHLWTGLLLVDHQGHLAVGHQAPVLEYMGCRVRGRMGRVHVCMFTHM